jgi:hypothetical protein
MPQSYRRQQFYPRLLLQNAILGHSFTKAITGHSCILANLALMRYLTSLFKKQCSPKMTSLPIVVQKLPWLCRLPTLVEKARQIVRQAGHDCSVTTRIRHMEFVMVTYYARCLYEMCKDFLKIIALQTRQNYKNRCTWASMFQQIVFLVINNCR